MPPSRQQLNHHFPRLMVREGHHLGVSFEGELGVVEAEEVEKGGVVIKMVDETLDDFVAELV